MLLPDTDRPRLRDLYDQPVVKGASRANGVLAVGFGDQGAVTTVELQGIGFEHDT